VALCTARPTAKLARRVLHFFEDNAEDLKNGKLSNADHDAVVQRFKSDAIRAIPFQTYGYVMLSRNEQRGQPKCRPRGASIVEFVK